MEVQVVQGATTPPGTPGVSPTVSIKPLRIILHKDSTDPVEMLRLLQHAGAVTDEAGEEEAA